MTLSNPALCGVPYFSLLFFLLLFLSPFPVSIKVRFGKDEGMETRKLQSFGSCLLTQVEIFSLSIRLLLYWNIIAQLYEKIEY